MVSLPSSNEIHREFERHSRSLADSKLFHGILFLHSHIYAYLRFEHLSISLLESEYVTRVENMTCTDERWDSYAFETVIPYDFYRIPWNRIRKTVINVLTIPCKNTRVITNRSRKVFRVQRSTQGWVFRQSWTSNIYWSLSKTCKKIFSTRKKISYHLFAERRYE